MRRGRIWLDMAGVTDIEWAATRSLWSGGIDELRPAESTQDAEHRYWNVGWLEFFGLVIRFGNPELPRMVDSIAAILRDARSDFTGETPLSNLFQEFIIRVIVSNGCVCETRLIDGTGIPREPCQDPAYEVSAWEGEPPKMLGWPDRAYYFILPQGLLQVLSITRM